MAEHNDDERDFEEERYSANLCPACGHSPCAGGGEKGSCEPPSVSLNTLIDLRVVNPRYEVIVNGRCDVRCESLEEARGWRDDSPDFYAYIIDTDDNNKVVQ